MKGQVLRVIAGFYDVWALGNVYRVRGSGRLRQENSTPFVGDWVDFEPNQVIKKVHLRKNFLNRPKVANVDQVAIVFSCSNPDFKPFLLHKILANIEYQKIKVILIFTKIDLAKELVWQDYLKANYPVYLVNNFALETMEKLEESLQDKLTVFAGPSGVGKSSLLSNIIQKQLKIGEISKALKRGKHTTRVVEALPWKHGWVIDTPGFSSIDLQLKKSQIREAFRIFDPFVSRCEFSNCAHIKEITCGVKQAIDEHKIPKVFYNNYVKMYKEAQDG